MSVNYRHASIGHHKKGYTDHVIEERFDSRWAKVKYDIHTKLMLWEFEHRQIELGEETWHFKPSWHNHVSKVVRRLVGEFKEPERTYYQRRELGQ